MLKLFEVTEATEKTPMELSDKLVRELEEIAPIAEKRDAIPCASPTSWVYRMPFVGVRFYSYE